MVPAFDESVNDGPVEYVCHAAPLKFDASLAMYCVGLPLHQLVSVTVRDGVDAAAMLSRYIEVTDGGWAEVTLTVMSPQPANSPSSASIRRT